MTSSKPTEKKKNGKAKKIVIGTLHVLFPIMSSLKHFKKTTKNTIDSAIIIKDMAKELKNKATQKEVESTSTFNEAINKTGKNKEELINIFLIKKRVYLFMFYILFLTLIILFPLFLIHGKYFQLINSSLILLSVGSIFFLHSYSSQFRIWQLQNCRLSKKEKGGLADFREESNWLTNTLKFSVGTAKK